MSLTNALQLTLLAAIWGGSFLFMRVAAPEFGAIWLSELRVLLAALTLLLVAQLMRRRLLLLQYWRHYLIIGFFNSALPFVLFSYAALSLTASLLSIMNATAPIWGVLFTACYERRWMERKTALGLLLGVVGVAVLVGFDSQLLADGALLPLLAAITAAICYGLASTYTRYTVKVEAFNNAHGSMWGAVVVLLPFLLWSQPQLPVLSLSPQLWLAVVALGVVCTAIAYLLYFKLIRDVGAGPALCVTFLIPLFGVLWGSLFLGETLGWQTVVGGSITVLGTMLVTGFSPRKLLRRRTHVV